MSNSLLYLLLFATTLFRTTRAWGAAGHELVATIAQVYLHPSVLPTVCALLDIDVDKRASESTLRSKCHLASIATWADRERMRMRWSAALHYVGAVGDHPRDSCTFPGTEGWAGTKYINVLDGIKNVTHILGEWSGVSEESVMEDGVRTSPTLPLPPPSARHEEAFKFLVHFLGDMHQPLHLTGRDRGGNGDKVRWGNRESNLHSTWDTLIPAKLIRTVPRNYSRALPEPGSFGSIFASNRNSPRARSIGPTSARIESALRGTIYDPLVRRIIWEGVWNRWDEEVSSWSACPVPDPIPEEAKAEQEVEEKTSLMQPLQRIADVMLPFSLSRIFSGREKVEILPDGPVVCPYTWAKPIHSLNCEYIWPEESAIVSDAYSLGRPPRHPNPALPDLDTVAYMGPIERDMVVEKLFAQGGLRLAGLLNWLFAAEDN